MVKESPFRFTIPRHRRMRVPGVVFATHALLPDLAGDRSLQQVVNVAELPGIVEASYAMPDVHWGYGFPIGGVAATDVARGGVVSPGGIGFDISCGVRLLAASLSGDELASVLGRVMDRLSAAIPRGAGRGGVWRLPGRAEMGRCCLAAPSTRSCLATAPGVTWSGARTMAQSATPTRRRSAIVPSTAGCTRSAASAPATAPWKSRQWIFDPAAERFGLTAGQVCVMIHCGSRGLGQVVAAAGGAGLCRKVARLVPLGVVKG